MYLNGYGDDVGAGIAPNIIVFNSTKYPGICKPSNKYTLDAFKELQRQLNRVAQLRGLAKIGVDGDIGPGAVGLANKALGAPASCTSIASSAPGYASQAKIMADSGGAPATVAGPLVIKPSTLVNAATGVEVIAPSSGIAANVGNAFANMSPIAKLAAVGILGGIGYYVWKGRKR